MIYLLSVLIINSCSLDKLQKQLVEVDIKNYVDIEALDESNNGFANVDGTLHIIKNLDITKEKFDLTGIKTIIFFSKNNDNNGFAIFDKEIDRRYYFPDRLLNLFIAPIKNNILLEDSKKEIFHDNIKILSDLVQIDKDSYYFYYVTQENFTAKSLILNVINNGELKTYEIEANLKNIDKLSVLPNPFLNLKIDKNGNGWYFYDSFINFNFYTLKNFKKDDEKLKDILEESEEYFIQKKLKKYKIEYSSLDSNGTGYLLFSKPSASNRSVKEFYYQKFLEFKNENEKSFIFSSSEVYDFNNYYEFSADNSRQSAIYINKKGDGVVFFNKKTTEKEVFKYLYMKKVKNFKIDDIEIKLTESNKYVYSNFSINEKGNGLVVLKENNKNSCVIKKIRNYDIEK